MELSFFNSQTKQKQNFEPIDAQHIKMYVCGPTVYNYIHIGNGRPAVVFDVLFRLLSKVYPKVTYARNITDIDDKINNAAAEQGVSIAEFAQKFTDAYAEDMEGLGNLVPTLAPKATDFIVEMLDMLKELIKRGHAYESQGHVLFSVESMDDYGKLSNRAIEDMVAGASERVEEADYKRHPMDFVLWKPSTGEQPGWDSDYGFGRPGWHTECVAMIQSLLGDTIDIHGGGMDLKFPHHENEMAQGKCCKGKNEQYVNLWMHNAMINIGGEKMSKSLGNFITARELLGEHSGELLRFTLLSAQYRSTLNWNDDLLEQNQAALDKFYGALRKVSDVEATYGELSQNEAVQALADDLNTPLAFSVLHRFAGDINKSSDSQELASLKGLMLQAGEVLGLLQQPAEQWFKSDTGVDEATIEALIAKRNQAKKDKDFATADSVRAQLLDMGIEIQDTREGTRWQAIR